MIFAEDAGFTAVEFEADDFVSLLVDQMNAVLLDRVIAIDDRLVARAIRTDKNGIRSRAVALGLQSVGPGVAAFQKHGIARVQGDARGFGQGLPGRDAR